MITKREEREATEIDRIAEAYSGDVREEVRFRPETFDGRIVMMDHKPFSVSNPIYAIVYLLSYSLKVGLLIFNKLDDIHTLLWQQELRERNKEGR